MRHFDGRPLFLPRYVSTVGYELDTHEQDLYDAVTDYVANGLGARPRNTVGGRFGV